MRKYMQKSTAFLIALIMLLALVPQMSAVAAQPFYSTSSNSGTRDEVCTTLDGTGAEDYYTGIYTYDNLDDLSGSELQARLNTLMKSTHTYQSSYNDCHEKANKTDCENGDGRVSLIYTSYSATMSQWNGWNREHVWPKSLGGDSTKGGGADLHHIRPSDSGVNSSRGNKKYGEAGSGAKEKYGTDPAVGVLGGTYNSAYFEPLDNVKGDVARICLYVYVRWNSEWGATSITKVFQSVDVLLEWCEMDPVDTWEMGRNEVVEEIQGNRNVFIDYPELAWLLFDREIPEGMTTPSSAETGGTTGGGNNGNDTPGGSGDDAPSLPTVDMIHDGVLGTHSTTGTVVAVNAKSYLLADETGAILVYLNTTPTVSVGDKLVIEGTTSSYGGVVQFGADTTYTKVGSEQVQAPAPTRLDGAACDAYLNGVTVDYVKVVGKLSTSGSGSKTYYNLEIEDADITGSITYPASTSALSAYVGKTVEVTGYVTGVTGSTAKYLNIMMTDICEYDAGTVCTHPTTKIVGAEPATCGRAGYTGDTLCAICEEKLANGTAIDPTGDHTNTEVKNASGATCEQPGYTGDLYCNDCKATVSMGETIPVADHTFGKPEVILEATEQSGGTVKKVCTVCRSIVFEDTPKLEKKEEATDPSKVIIITVSSVGGVSVIAILFFVLKKFLIKK